MQVVLAPGAERDVEEVDAWWRDHRPDSRAAIIEELEAAFEHLSRHAETLPVFRRIGTIAVRRYHLPRTHRHLYLTVESRRVIVLAVWGSVRAVLPKLDARIRERS